MEEKVEEIKQEGKEEEAPPEPEKPVENDSNGVKEKAPKSKIDDANDASDRLEKAAQAMKKQNDRFEKLQEDVAAEGVGLSGVRPKKEEEGPIEYSQRVLRGEVNPLAL